MKIDMLGVQAFIAIADHGSFSRAADALFITQTALSRRLINLESFLGVKLVERSTRSVALTDIGRNFLPQARRLLDDLSMALLEIRQTGKASRGNVSLACVPTVGVRYLVHAIKEYARRYPENRIRIVDETSAGVENAVLRRQVEFGISIASRHHDDLRSVTLVRDRFVLVCRSDHPLARRKKITWKQVEPYPLIFPGVDSSNRPVLDVVLASHGLQPQAFYEVQRSSTALGFVAEGVAAAVVPMLALQKGTYPTLRTLELTDPVVYKDFVLLTRKGSELSPAAQALFNLIQKLPRKRASSAA